MLLDDWKIEHGSCADSNIPRVSYSGTDTYEYAAQAWSTMIHSGLFIKYRPMRAPWFR
jgi:hypothetical protein